MNDGGRRLHSVLWLLEHNMWVDSGINSWRRGSIVLMWRGNCLLVNIRHTTASAGTVRIDDCGLWLLVVHFVPGNTMVEREWISVGNKIISRAEVRAWANLRG